MISGCERVLPFWTGEKFPSLLGEEPLSLSGEEAPFWTRERALSLPGEEVPVWTKEEAPFLPGEEGTLLSVFASLLVEVTDCEPEKVMEMWKEKETVGVFASLAVMVMQSETWNGSPTLQLRMNSIGYQEGTVTVA